MNDTVPQNDRPRVMNADELASWIHDLNTALAPAFGHTIPLRRAWSQLPASTRGIRRAVARAIIEYFDGTSSRPPEDIDPYDAEPTLAAELTRVRGELDRERAIVTRSTDENLRLSAALRAAQKVLRRWRDPEKEVVLRPKVRLFAEAMERKLRKHDATRGDNGWENDRWVDLFVRVKDELRELEHALDRLDVPGIKGSIAEMEAAVLSEAADTANFLMFVADVTGALKAI